MRIGGKHQESAAPPAGYEAKAWSWSAFVSTYLPALILAIGTGIALPVVPKIAKSFHVGFSLATGVTTAFLIGSVLGTIPTGWLVDRVGRRRIMLLGPILTAAMAFLVLTARNFPELLVYRFFDGCASQMWLIGRLAGISHGAAPNQRGRQVSWMFGMDNTGKFVGPLFGIPIYHLWGTRAPFAAYGFLALVALVPAYLFTKDTPRRDLPATTATGTATSAPAPAEAARRLTTRQIVLPRLVYFAVAFCAGLARGPVQAQVYTLYSSYRYHVGTNGIGYLAGAMGFIALPIGFTAGWMMDRFGRKRTMVPGFTGVALTTTGLAMTAFFHMSLTAFIVIFLLGIVMQSLTGGSIQTVGADVAPPEARGRFLGLWRFTGQGGTAISPVIFALIAHNNRYGPAFLYIGCAAAMVAILVARFVPETGGRNAKPQVATAPLEVPVVAKR
ncbi:MAG TPA: MFS transporter [Acidimicrobiales bacterium]|nr:MFS transporter [Acidimicrobiales bacterium]